jgi:hypothetical protein
MGTLITNAEVEARRLQQDACGCTWKLVVGDRPEEIKTERVSHCPDHCPTGRCRR